MENSRFIQILTVILCITVLIVIWRADFYPLVGLLIGYYTGIINVKWLLRDARKAMDKDKKAALKTYYKSLVFRLVIITLVFAVVAKFQPDWLNYVAIGMMTGIVIPIIVARHQLTKTKGGEN
ncbi:MAG: ATP synthase subunit I [Dehalobacter sp. 4CP]|uniref:ATP synthase subunit I n=1 Tax=Dehalobacter sp. CP TaxID=2594474 RepID=UPI0013C70664|nr:ATP synthase subunit I [Dehalobacter sp.]NBJ16662.1 ATP synthase subunit I [Dehalobacter sp. 4CP]